MAQIRIPVEKLPPPDKAGDHSFQFRIISVDKNQWSAWSQLYILKSIGQYRPLESDVTAVISSEEVSLTWETPTIYNYNSASATSASIAHNHSQNFKQHSTDIFVQWDGGDIEYHERAEDDYTSISIPASSASVRVFGTIASKNVPQIETFEDDEDYKTRLYNYLGIGSRKNLIPNPSFETNLTNWSGTNLTSTRSTTYAKYGTYSYKGVVATTGANRYIDKLQTDVFITTGFDYTYSCWVYLPLTNTADITLGLWAYGWNATGYAGPYVLETKLVTRGTWTRLSGTFNSINGTTGEATNVLFRVINQSSWAAGQEMYIDGALLEQSSNLDFYFDGTTIDSTAEVQDQIWNGTPNASTSILNYHIPNTIGTYDLLKVFDTDVVSLT
jgi:hypothetical protein